MIDYNLIFSVTIYTALILVFCGAMWFGIFGLIVATDKVVTKRRQHKDTLAEIRRLKADQAYAALHAMAGYLRAELKHGGHHAAEYTAYEHCQKNFWGILENNGIHLDEEYQ